MTTPTTAPSANPLWTLSADPARVGNKFARLHTMRVAGLPVPPLFCLPVECFRAVVEPLRERIAEAVAAADLEDPVSAAECAERVRELFLTAELPAGIEEQITEAFGQLSGPEALVAVRACGLDGEDSASDPYAGMSESFLYVPREAVVEKVRRCWASGFGAESLLYRHVQGIDPLRAEVAVGIQEMALGTRSFVLFTRDPRTGERTSVIAAGHGIGEGVVQERVGVDHYFLPAAVGEEATPPVEQHIADKPEMLGLDPARPDAGPVPLPVPEELRTSAVLDDAEIRLLASTGAAIEELFGGPQDIEGTFTADGALHLVQSRPIAIDLSLRAQWSNANVTESFPGITTALTYTFAQDFYRVIFYDLYRRLGVDARTLHADEPYLRRMIGLHNGRVYYRLDSWYHLHSRLAVFPLFQANWEKMMGLESSGPAKLPAPHRLVRPLLGVAKQFLVHDRTMREFEESWESVMTGRRGRDWSALDPMARIQDFHEVNRRAGDLWGVTLMNDSVLSTYAGIAQKLLEGWAPGEPLNDLLCGEEENHSVAVVMSTVRLAEQLREQPELLAVLETKPADEVWPDVEAGAYGPELPRAFAEHLHRHGDRGLQELKVEQPNLRRTPWVLLELTADYARSGLDRAGLSARERDIRAAAERRLEEKLGARSVKLRVLRTVLARLRTCVGHRENSRYRRSEWFGIAKEVFHSLGSDLAAQGVLREPGDVFHLEQDELLGFFDGTGTAESLQPPADARRAEYERPGPELPVRFSTLGAVRGSRPTGVAPATAVDGELRGLGSSAGVVRGRARVVLDPHQKVEPGSILVARETDPGWLFLMLRAAGIVVERGTMLSHTAITGRKFGIPTVVALPGATTSIPDGALVEMDGASGLVTVLEEDR